MTGQAASERTPPFAGLPLRFWEAEAHRLLVAPAGELTASELEAVRRLAHAVGRCASEFVREGGDGANPHGIESGTAPAAYVRFVVAVLHDFGPAATWELEQWKRRIQEDERLNDPRVEAFRRGYGGASRRGPAVRRGAGRVCTVLDGPGIGA